MEIAKRPVDQVKSIIQSDKFKDAVRQALPRHLTPDRFLRVALLAVTKNPKLAECTPESLFAAMLQVSSLGLEIDGRRAHLIPFGKDVQVIIDYKGIVELVMRSGEVSRLHADVVCENDEFSYNMGAIEFHRIDFRSSRGQPYAAYALAQMKDGSIATCVLHKDEIEAVRKRSRSGNSGPWVTDWNEMAKKTAFRRLSKWLPLSAELREKVESDDDDFPAHDVSATASATPASALLPERTVAPSDPPADRPRGPGRPRKNPTVSTVAASALTSEQAMLKAECEKRQIGMDELFTAASDAGLLAEGAQKRTDWSQWDDGEVPGLFEHMDSLVEMIQAEREINNPPES